MFYRNISKLNEEDSPISITDIDHNTFKQMIWYIYNEQIKFTSWKNACDLYEASKKYMIDQLTKLCLTYLKENVAYSNVFPLYEFAKFHSEENLEKLCLKEIQVNTCKVFEKDEELSDLSESTFITILQKEKLNISEIELFLTVARWADIQAEKQGSSNQREVAINLVRNLRFLTLTDKEFLDNVVNTSLLDEKEKLAILVRILNHNMPPMANKLSEKKTKRKEHKGRCVANLLIKGTQEARCDGSEWLTSIFKTDTRIDLLGVELSLQVMKCNTYYKENLMVKVGLANEKEHFAEGSFADKVPFNTTIEIKLNHVTTLEPNTLYAIHVFLCSSGIYPLGKHSNLSCENDDIYIEFLSHSSWESTHPCNVTVLRSIIYSDPLD